MVPEASIDSQSHRLNCRAPSRARRARSHPDCRCSSRSPNPRARFPRRSYHTPASWPRADGEPTLRGWPRASSDHRTGTRLRGMPSIGCELFERPSPAHHAIMRQVSDLTRRPWPAHYRARAIAPLTAGCGSREPGHSPSPRRRSCRSRSAVLPTPAVARHLRFSHVLNASWTAGYVEA
jgi:hypothetical protein